MGGLADVPGQVTDFGFQAVSFGLEATGEVASDPVGTTQDASITLAGLSPDDLGGVENEVLGSQTGLGVDPRLLALLAFLAIFAWYAGSDR